MWYSSAVGGVAIPINPRGSAGRKQPAGSRGGEDVAEGDDLPPTGCGTPLPARCGPPPRTDSSPFSVHAGTLFLGSFLGNATDPGERSVRCSVMTALSRSVIEKGTLHAAPFLRVAHLKESAISVNVWPGISPIRLGDFFYAHLGSGDGIRQS